MVELQDDNNSILQVEVAEYVLNGDPLYYDNHNFVIKVWIGQQFFTITRSYCSFCELDVRFRRQYPRSNLPILHLVGLQLFSKKYISKHQSTKLATGEKRGSIVDSRASMLFHGADNLNIDVSVQKKSLMRRVDTVEVIGHKRTILHAYLQDLLKIPEVLVSDLLLFFLDEESIDGEVICDLPISAEDGQLAQGEEIAILLKGEVPVTKVVRKDFSIDFNVDSTNVVVWDFSTKFYDIGFTVLFEGAQVFTYQRCASQAKTVRGAFEIPSTGKLSLQWDNSYSKMRVKILQYLVRVVSREDFELALSCAADSRKEKSKFHKQRQAIKKLLVRASQELLAASNTHVGGLVVGSLRVDGSSSRLSNDLPALHGDRSDAPTVSSHSVQSIFASVDPTELYRTIEQLRMEKRCLQQVLAESESALVEERTSSARHVQLAEDAAVLREVLEEELTCMRNELDNYRQEQAEREQCSVQEVQEQYERRKEFSAEQLLTLPIEEVDSYNALSYFEIIREHARSLITRLAATEETCRSVGVSASKLRSDKKQLKVYALQLKTSVDLLTQQIELSEHEKQLAQSESEALRQKIGSLDGQLHDLLLTGAVKEQSQFTDCASVSEPSHPDVSEANESDLGALGVPPAETTTADTPEVLVLTSSANAGHFFREDYSDEDEPVQAASLRRGHSSASQSNMSQSNVSSPKLVTIDLAAPPPDELSTYLTTMRSSLYELMPSWREALNGSASERGGDTMTNRNQSTFGF